MTRVAGGVGEDKSGLLGVRLNDYKRLFNFRRKRRRRGGCLCCCVFWWGFYTTESMCHVNTIIKGCASGKRWQQQGDYCAHVVYCCCGFWWWWWSDISKWQDEANCDKSKQGASLPPTNIHTLGKRARHYSFINRWAFYPRPLSVLCCPLCNRKTGFKQLLSINHDFEWARGIATKKKWDTNNVIERKICRMSLFFSAENGSPQKFWLGLGFTTQGIRLAGYICRSVLIPLPESCLAEDWVVISCQGRWGWEKVKHKRQSRSSSQSPSINSSQHKNKTTSLSVSLLSFPCRDIWLRMVSRMWNALPIDPYPWKLANNHKMRSRWACGCGPFLHLIRSVCGRQYRDNE